LSRIETVWVVSDPQPTVEDAVKQMAARLDSDLRNLVRVFQEAGDQLWTAEPASHTVTAVPGVERRPSGLFGHEDVPVTRHVASALTLVSFQQGIS